MAATSSSSSSRPPRNKHTDSFRPQFPINPFGHPTLTPEPSSSSISSSLSEPWLLKPDQVPSSAAYRRDVVLVLGTPSERSVAALLASISLVHSLVIFATHSPPALPASPAPTVRVLRLVSPLAVEDSGAVKLVSTLEWAERVARLWRAYGSDGADVVCYDEVTKDLPATTPGSFSRNFVNTPSDSAESLGKKSFRSRAGLPIFTKRRPSTSSTISGLLSSGSLPPVDPSQRPFDAILNCIPHDVAEKHVLKQTILVTSITRPFLSPTLSPYHKLSEAKKNSRRSSTSRIYSLPPTPPYQSGDLSTPASSSMTAISVLSTPTMPPPLSHLVHIIPPTARTALIRSLDSFLSSFSQQAVGTDQGDLAKQYIVNSSTMRETIDHPNFEQDECTVLDLILLGGLDPVSGKSWVGSAQDILFLPTSSPSSAPSTPPIPRRPTRSPSRILPDSFQPVDPVSPPRVRTQSSPQLLLPSGGSSPTRTRRSGDMLPEHRQPVSEQAEFGLSNLSPHLDPVRHPHLQGPSQPSSLGASSRGTIRRSKLNMTTKPDDSVSFVSGLPTPPDSDEDTRQASPQLRTLISEAPMLRKKKSRWQFWKLSARLV